MKVSVHLGAAHAACMASIGHDVVGVDIGCFTLAAPCTVSPLAVRYRAQPSLPLVLARHPENFAAAARRTTMLHSDDANPSVMSTDLPTGVYLLDVREDDEWAAGHAPDAVHIPVGTLGERSAEIPQDREVYVICRSGARSAYAAQALAGGGWKTVNVADGMTGWAVAGRPMVSETGSEPYVA
jgi:rhodanese-related sulfurtransferase